MGEETAQRQYSTRAARIRPGGQIRRGGAKDSEEGYEGRRFLQGQLFGRRFGIMYAHPFIMNTDMREEIL